MESMIKSIEDAKDAKAKERDKLIRWPMLI